MNLLKEKIRKEGRVAGGSILKVDVFLNHQLDIAFLQEIGKEFHRIFGHCQVDKILTVEASGIAIASITSQYFNNCPVVFAKKARSQNIDGDTFVSEVFSYTYSKTFPITVAKKFLHPGENVLIIDDFLAEGNALKGLTDVLKQANCTVQGIGIVIEKAFQSGGKLMRDQGYNIHSLARIESMDENGVVFAD